MNQYFIATALASIWFILAIGMLIFISSKKSAKVKRQWFPYLMLSSGVILAGFLYVASLNVKTLDFDFAIAALIFAVGFLFAFTLTGFCDFCGACFANRYDVWHKARYCAECGQKLSTNSAYPNSNITAKKLLLLGYFFCVACACVALPSILRQTGCCYYWQPFYKPLPGISLLLTIFYGLLTSGLLADLFNLKQKITNNRILRISPSNKKIIQFGALLVSLPVMATTVFLSSMLLLWRGYNESRTYWDSYKAIIGIEAKLFGAPIAQLWCVPPAEVAWYRKDESAVKKYCDLAIACQNKNALDINYDSNQLLQLGNLYWKTGLYEDALVSFNQAHTIIGAKANDRHYASEPVVIDLRPDEAMQPVIVDLYDYRDCLDNCIDKLGIAKAQSQFPKFKHWLHDRSIHHGKYFDENNLIVLDVNTYENMCQASKSHLKQLTIPGSVLDKIYHVPASWIAKLQKES